MIPRWYTYKQILELNQQYEEKFKLDIKGEKGTKIEYWFLYDKKEKKNYSFEEAKILIENNFKVREDFKLKNKIFVVFNGQQIKNLKPFEKKAKQNILLDELIYNLGIKIVYNDQNKSYYDVKKDCIFLPKISYFINQHEYDFTLLHEISHATGHPKRLNRNLSFNFGTKDYAFEELIAELSACFIGFSFFENNMDYKKLKNHFAYVSSWIKEIEADNNFFFKAVEEASKVSDYLKKYLIVKERDSE